MSDTPETDKNTWSDSSEGILYKVVTSDFARKLERERDEARKELNEQKNRASYNLDLAKRGRDLFEKCEKERDEAIAERDILRLDAQREAEHHDRLVKELENLYDKLKSQRS